MTCALKFAVTRRMKRRKLQSVKPRTTHGNFRTQFFTLAEGRDKALDKLLEVLGVEMGD